MKVLEVVRQRPTKTEDALPAVMETLQVQPAARSETRRGGVSASVLSMEDALSHVKVVISKDVKTVAALKNAVEHNVLFMHMEADELQAVLDAMFPCTKSPGEIIMKQGDDGDNFYVIASGKVEIWIAKGSGPSAKISELGEWLSFGELALMHGTPRSATVKAKTECKLWAIDRDTYRRILMQSTLHKRKLLEAFLTKVPLLKDLNKFEKQSVADSMESVEYQANQTVMKQGDAGNDFYIVVQGSLKVFKDGKEVLTLGATQYFGELALLNGSPRAATVTAVTHVKLCKLDRGRFERVLGPCVDILRRDMKNYAKISQ